MVEDYDHPRRWFPCQALDHGEQGQRGGALLFPPWCFEESRLWLRIGEGDHLIQAESGRTSWKWGTGSRESGGRGTAPEGITYWVLASYVTAPPIGNSEISYNSVAGPGYQRGNKRSSRSSDTRGKGKAFIAVTATACPSTNQTRGFKEKTFSR